MSVKPLPPSTKGVCDLGPEVLDGFFNAPLSYTPNMWFLSTQIQVGLIIRSKDSNIHEGTREELG